MQNKSFKRTIMHDLSFGIYTNISKYVLVIFFFFSLCIIYFTDTLHVENVITEKLTITDFWIFFFKGMNIYIPAEGNFFQIPVIWILSQVLFSLVVFNYPTQDLYTYGTQILIRTKNRFSWWISKCIWNIFSICLCYFIAFVSACIFSFILGQFSFIPSISINDINIELFVAIFLLPPLTTITITLFQMTLSFILSPVYSFFIVMCYLIASAYYCSPALIGNFSMIIRNQLFEPDGSNNLTAIIVNISLIVIIILIGLFYFRKHDILKKR